jgi:hypothetical protein
MALVQDATGLGSWSCHDDSRVTPGRHRSLAGAPACTAPPRLSVVCPPPPPRSRVIAESTARPATLTALMRDQYGNYVVQRCLEVADAAQLAALLAAIKVGSRACAAGRRVWWGCGAGWQRASSCMLHVHVATKSRPLSNDLSATYEMLS